MNWFSKKENSTTQNIQWEKLDSLTMLNDLITLSNEKIVVIFKHSTRCSISSMAKSRFEREWDYNQNNIVTYYLDLLNFREISDKIASEFDVTHQSPQMLVIKNEKCIYHNSHQMISAESLERFI